MYGRKLKDVTKSTYDELIANPLINRRHIGKL